MASPQKTQTTLFSPSSQPPWPGGGGGGGGGGQGGGAAASGEEGRGANNNNDTAPAPAPPPPPPRRILRPMPPPRASSARVAAVITTGQSRFVEGSMNDRVSAAPPAVFLGIDHDGDDSGDGDDDDGEVRGEMGVWERRGGSGHGYQLRRPRSSAGPVRDRLAQQQQQQQQQNGKKGGFFLAPLWDGVREKLHLSRSRSSGNIVSVAAGRKGGQEEEEARAGLPTAAPAAAAGYPTREEVLESYKNLVASGFFEAHAIRGTRHPLRTAPTPAGDTPAPSVPAVPFPAGKSFADHLAAEQRQREELKPAFVFSSPLRSSLMPPPPSHPPRMPSQGNRDSISSPQRGTKRGAPVDGAADSETATRKFVKKLRRSVSRISIDLTKDQANHRHYVHASGKSRPSTSSNVAVSPVSPTSPIFGRSIGFPSIIVSPAGDDPAPTAMPSPGKLSKPSKETFRRRRILGLGRRRRSATPATPPRADANADADGDIMLVDDPPEQQQQQQQQQQRSHVEVSPPKPAQVQEQERRAIRKVTPPPPPSAFHHYHYPQRVRNTSVHHHEPLRVVPDPNQGIPAVPRIPSELCGLPRGMVQVEDKDGKQNANSNRDSGLGEDVENIPIWG
ncbi:hypothetical protein VTK56DRAFT_3843 [Thermocarpiscus australiensis]